MIELWFESRQLGSEPVKPLFLQKELKAERITFAASPVRMKRRVGIFLARSLNFILKARTSPASSVSYRHMRIWTLQQDCNLSNSNSSFSPLLPGWLIPWCHAPMDGFWHVLDPRLNKSRHSWVKKIKIKKSGRVILNWEVWILYSALSWGKITLNPLLFFSNQSSTCFLQSHFRTLHTHTTFP